MAKLSRSAEQIRLARTRVIRITELITTVFSYSIKWGALAFIAYEFKECVKALAGQETIVSIFSSMAANVTFNKWAAYVLGAGGTGYGLLQRRLRKRKVAELGARIKVLEKVIDPKRTTSGLSPDGEAPNG